MSENDDMRRARHQLNHIIGDLQEAIERAAPGIQGTIPPGNDQASALASARMNDAGADFVAKLSAGLAEMNKLVDALPINDDGGA